MNVQTTIPNPNPAPQLPVDNVPPILGEAALPARPQIPATAGDHPLPIGPPIPAPAGDHPLPIGPALPATAGDHPLPVGPYKFSFHVGTHLSVSDVQRS